jgi:hypothetical protein
VAALKAMLQKGVLVSQDAKDGTRIKIEEKGITDFSQEMKEMRESSDAMLWHVAGLDFLIVRTLPRCAK